MATVFDVASYILQKKGRMSTWKLQKLCYYSQAWNLVWTEKPLFDEDFEAWSNGPVCRELFYKHKGIFLIDKIEGNPHALIPAEKETVDMVLRDYGDMDAYELRELTHSEDPWKNARNGLGIGVPCDVVITKDAIGEYYGGL